MKYIEYISQEKIEMLYEQSKKSHHKKHGFDVEVAVSVIKGKINRNVESQYQASLYEKCDIVTKELRKDNQIGDIDSSKQWININRKMFKDIFRGSHCSPPYVIWGCCDYNEGNLSILYLTGSLHNMLGNNEPNKSSFVSALEHFYEIASTISNDVSNNTIRDDKMLAFWALHALRNNWLTTDVNYDGIAKILCRKDFKNFEHPILKDKIDLHLTLATPLYMAIE